MPSRSTRQFVREAFDDAVEIFDVGPDALHQFPREAVQLFLAGFGVFVHVRIRGIGHFEERGADIPEGGRGRELQAVQHLKRA